MASIKQMLQSSQSVSDIPLRIGVGTVFVAHGAQKLFGAFGGYGLEGTGQWMASIGLEPGYLMALLAGSAEFFGGLLILAGLLTRPAAALGLFTMLVAIFAAHWAGGFFLTNNGYEYAFALALMSAALMIQGAGRLSLDALIFGKEQAA